MIRELELTGTPRERGRAHGEALRSLVHEHLERWRDALAADLGVEPERYVERFLAATNFLPAIERWTPELLDEVRGIAEGAGTDFRFTFARQLSDEEPWYRREVKNGLGAARGCSSIGADARDGQPLIVAQNMDLPTWWDGHQVLLRIREPDGHQILVFTVAGKISLCGLNSAGLGICCNTLSQLDYARDGLAEDFVVRGYLRHRSPQAGLEFMRRIKHASGQNYTVPGPDGRALNLECSARSVTEYRPWPGADRVYHTNHPLTNPDRALYEAHTRGLSDDELYQRYGGSSALRFDEFVRWFGAPARPVTVERIKAALSSRNPPAGPLSRTGEAGGRKDQFTLGSLIMECAATSRLYLAPGPPHCTDFSLYGF